MKGIVSSGTLNVRDAADKSGNKLGVVTMGTQLEVLGEENGWFKINYNGSTAYVMKTFVDVEYAKVLSDTLNVRATASKDGAILGKLAKDNVVYPTGYQDGWVQISYNGNTGYISADYALIVNFDLAPAKKLKGTNSDQNLVADVWNKYGTLLARKSDSLGIEIATAIAFLCVESGGKGFWKEGKCLIRFENHLFWDAWGKNNADTYNKFFKYDQGKRWLGHCYRKTEDGDWITQHDSGQEKEWDSFQFAYSLNGDAAISSISMGAPQILGSNYKVLGYSSYQDMFDKFNADIKYHILGFFDFCASSPNNIKYLKANDFTNIAKFYNGPGQAERYGSFIKKYHDAFAAIFK